MSQTHTNDITHLYTRFTRPHRRYRRPIQMISHIYTHVSHGHTDDIADPYKWYHTSVQTLSHSLTNNIHCTPYKHHCAAKQTSPINTTEPYGHHGTTQTTLCSHHRAIQTSPSHTNIIEPYKHHWAIQTILHKNANIELFKHHWAIQTILHRDENVRTIQTPQTLDPFMSASVPQAYRFLTFKQYWSI